MPYRTRQALLGLVSTGAICIWYFAGERHPGGYAGQPARLIAMVMAVVMVRIVGTLIIAGTASDRYQPIDERERAFDRMATGVGYHLMIAGSLIAVATVHPGARGPGMADAVLVAIAIAECARHGLFLALRHRAAR